MNLLKDRSFNKKSPGLKVFVCIQKNDRICKTGRKEGQDTDIGI